MRIARRHGISNHSCIDKACWRGSFYACNSQELAATWRCVVDMLRALPATVSRVVDVKLIYASLMSNMRGSALKVLSAQIQSSDARCPSTETHSRSTARGKYSYHLVIMANPANFAWDVRSQEIIDEWKEYHGKCAAFLRELERNGPANLVIPQKPGSDLAVLFPRKEKKAALAGRDLHHYLCKNLISETGFAIIIPSASASAVTNLDVLGPYLKNGYKKLQRQTAESIAAHLDFGALLLTAYDLFHLKKSTGQTTGTWAVWVRENVGVCERYERELREIANFLNGYPKFKKLGISFKELRKHKQQIRFMLKNDQFAAFWKQP